MTVFERHHCRHHFDGQAHRQVRVLVYVHLDEDKSPAVFTSQSFQDGPELSAGATPGRIKIHYDGCPFRLFEHHALKLAFANFNDPRDIFLRHAEAFLFVSYSGEQASG
jgi:hypothetical protein